MSDKNDAFAMAARTADNRGPDHLIEAMRSRAGIGGKPAPASPTTDAELVEAMAKAMNPVAFNLSESNGNPDWIGWEVQRRVALKNSKAALSVVRAERDTQDRLLAQWSEEGRKHIARLREIDALKAEWLNDVRVYKSDLAKADIDLTLVSAEREAAIQERDALKAALKPKIAPVQGYTLGIPWAMHLRAYDAYKKKYGRQDALIDLEGRNCRGGFSARELDAFIPGWRDELSEITALRAEVASLRALGDQGRQTGRAQADADGLRDKLAMAERALKPFAEVCATLDRLYPGYKDHVTVMGWDCSEITHGDLRLAREALAKIKTT